MLLSDFPFLLGEGGVVKLISIWNSETNGLNLAPKAARIAITRMFMIHT